MNRSFPLTRNDARRELRRMGSEPVALPRPVVVLGGYGDPAFAATWIKRVLGRVTRDSVIVGMSFFSSRWFADCRAKVIAEVDRRFPSEDEKWTREVDVVGFSMGGLIGRYAAAEIGGVGPEMGYRRLRIARLFTISTPHRGASKATLPAAAPLQRDMRIGSAFLMELARAAEDKHYAMYPYVRLRDWVVGEQNAAPAGENPWWVPKVFGEPSHMLAFADARILADIARRLRGEQPFTVTPAEPVPR